MSSHYYNRYTSFIYTSYYTEMMMMTSATTTTMVQLLGTCQMCVISLDTQRMSRHARSHCRCRPCSRAAQPLLLRPPVIWASIPLILGLSDSPSQIPITTPPRMARQLHSKPMKMGLAPLPFSHSQAACLLLPTSLVVDEHAPRLGHACRFSARTLHAALPAVLPPMPPLR